MPPNQAPTTQLLLAMFCCTWRCVRCVRVCVGWGGEPKGSAQSQGPGRFKAQGCAGRPTIPASARGWEPGLCPLVPTWAGRQAEGSAAGECGWAATKTPFTVLQAQSSITCFPLAALASLFRGCRLGEICSGCRHQPRPHKRERESKKRASQPAKRRDRETETHKGRQGH